MNLVSSKDFVTFGLQTFSNSNKGRVSLEQNKVKESLSYIFQLKQAKFN